MNGCQSLGNGDLISELPDALLLQILSIIPTKDALATSVLSKRWRFLCKMMPNLSFLYGSTKGIERFSNNVCRCLLSHQAPVLQSLDLTMCFLRGSIDDTGVMNLLMGVAFGLHVRELRLHVFTRNELFKFPTSLFNCGTLETLKLIFRILLDVPFPVRLRSLRTLRLYGVKFQDDESVVNLLSGCPILENLEVKIYSSPDLETFTIDVPSLRSLTLISENERFPVYVINAPCLKYLKIKGIIIQDDSSSLIKIENAPELVEAYITGACGVIYENIHGSLTSVKRLCLKISSPMDLTKFPTNRIFNQLVYLVIHIGVLWWNLLMIMLDSSPNLQVLKLIREWFRKQDMGWSQPNYVPECLANSLDTFVWEDYEGEVEDEREVAQYILRNASRLETATFSKFGINPEKRLERLKELESVVWASNSCKLVFKED